MRYLPPSIVGRAIEQEFDLDRVVDAIEVERQDAVSSPRAAPSLASSGDTA